ncbi:MAG: hypothetical protein ACOYXT_08790 [Bacteroidota bacterium]
MEQPDLSGLSSRSSAILLNTVTDITVAKYVLVMCEWNGMPSGLLTTRITFQPYSAVALECNALPNAQAQHGSSLDVEQIIVDL